MKVTIFDDNGLVSGYVSHSDQRHLSTMIGSRSWIKGQVPNTKRLINGELIDLPDYPGDGIYHYRFDVASEQWIIDLIPTEISIRQHRDRLLQSQIDTVNPVRYNTLTDQQRMELETYRQALLDVPQQAGFPGSVDWPAKPAWL